MYIYFNSTAGQNCRFSAKPKCHTFKSSTSYAFSTLNFDGKWGENSTAPLPVSDGNSPAQQRWLQSASLSYWTILIFPAPPSLNLEKQRENFHSNALRTAQHSKQCSLFQNISLMERTLQLKFSAFAVCGEFSLFYKTEFGTEWEQLLTPWDIFSPQYGSHNIRWLSWMEM